MKLQMLLVLVVATLVSRCSGYPGGAPNTACASMTPSHSVDAQASDPPYNISVSNTAYTVGGSLTVTVKGNANEMFRGIFVQARLANCSGTTNNVPQGTFVLNTTDTQLQLVNCSVPGSAVTHNSKVDKTAKSFTWTAPAIDVGFVYIQVTIVQNITVFWTGLNSETIKGPSNMCRPKVSTTPAAPGSESTTPSGSEPITTSFLLIAFCSVLSFLRRC